MAEKGDVEVEAGDLQVAEARLLRPLLERAVAVARADSHATPARQLPAGLRPYLRFSKLPATAESVVRRVLDADADFRQRVAEHDATEAVALPQVHRHWLLRGEGWRGVWDAEVRAEAERLAVRRGVDCARRDRRRIDSLVAESERLRAERDALASEVAALRKVVADDAASHRRADRAAAEVEAAQRARAATEADLATTTAENEAQRQRIAELERQIAGLREANAGLRTMTPEGVIGRLMPVATSIDVAAHAVATLQDAVSAIQAEIASVADSVSCAPCTDAARPSVTAAPSSNPTPRRVPLKAGRGLEPGEPAAIEWYLNVDGMKVFVDGYNASLTLWPQLTLPLQRQALVRGIRDLALRSTAEFAIVFDGTHDTGAAPVAGSNQVRVTFSPPDVEADDVILDSLAHLPPTRPALVVSADRRVQDGAIAVGANVVEPRDLLPLLVR